MEKTRKLNNLLYFDKENPKDIKADFLNELEKVNALHQESNTNPNYNSKEKIIKFLTLPN